MTILKYEGIEKVLVSNKISPGQKDYEYFIGYLYDDYKVKRLHIMLPDAYFFHWKMLWWTN